MSDFKSDWCYAGGHTAAFRRSHAVGFTPMVGSLQVPMTMVLLAGGGCVMLEGSVDEVTSRIFGQWPPDATAEDALVGTRQPLETMNVSGMALAMDIHAAWRELVELERALPPEEAAPYGRGADAALRLLCARLGVDIAIGRGDNKG